MTIFVGNLSYEATEEDLMAAFSQFGGVERVNIATDRFSGQPRGFAFVDMTNSSEAQKAVSQLNGRELRGRKMTVSEARSKPAARSKREGLGGQRKVGGVRDNW